MVIFILLNIVIIIYVYLKYYKSFGNLHIQNEEIEKQDSIIIGYMNDKGFDNNFDLMLAEIVNLNIKGYIEIQYSNVVDKYSYIIKQKIDAKSKEISEYEMLMLNFLFNNKTEITKEELEIKLKNTFSSYNIQYNELSQILNQKLIEQSLIDNEKQVKLKKRRKIYIELSIIFASAIVFLGIMDIVSVLYIVMYILAKITSSVLLLKASIYTTKGQIWKYNIDKYKIRLEDKEFLVEKNTMQDIVKNKEFADSLALHINTEAKKAFIDNQMIKDALGYSKKVGLIVLAISVTILLIVLLFSKLIVSIPREAIAWIFILLVIAVACSADIVYSKGYKRK